MPNAGKSTFLSVLSAAKPKIADYPFTTLAPVLGVVKTEEYRSFVVADIPGLIEGAHMGVGLGFQFLRHVERTSLLLHLVDISETGPGDPVENLKKINGELEQYSPDLIKKPQVVLGTKLDIVGNGERLASLETYCAHEKIAFFPVSAVTGHGIKHLVSYLSTAVENIRTGST